MTLFFIFTDLIGAASRITLALDEQVLVPGPTMFEHELYDLQTCSSCALSRARPEGSGAEELPDFMGGLAALHCLILVV